VLKHWMEAVSAIDFVTIGMLLSVVAAAGQKRLESCIRTYTMNSCLLALLVIFTALYTRQIHLYMAAFLTIAGKCFLIPYLLRKVIRDLKIKNYDRPFASMWLSLLASFILVLIVYSAFSEGIFVTGITRNALKISISIILIGLFIMITRRKAITQVIGLLFMENGLFLAGFSLTYGMPALVELGVLFDMLMGLIILSVFLSQIKKVFVSVDLDKLTTLKG
jgi:hydrogenase-4 component E